MTQYMLIVGLEPKNTLERLGIFAHKIHDSKEFIARIAANLFSDNQIRSCWYPESKVVGSVHDLFSQAYIDIQEGKRFDETDIGHLLINILPMYESIALWYSNGYNNLPCTESTDSFMNTITSSLMQDSGEIYLRINK